MPTALKRLQDRDPKFREALAQAREVLGKIAQPEATGIESASVAFDLSEIEGAAEVLDRGEAESVLATPGDAMVEAIVRSTLRPSFYMSNDRVLSQREGLSNLARQLMDGMDLDFDDRALFDAKRGMLEARARSAGRLDLFNGFREYAGTGWLVDESVVVTNRHVAGLFARRWMADQWEFQDGQFDRRVEVRLNPLEQIDTANDPVRSAIVTEILWVAGPGEPDMAFLRVHAPGAEPIPLAASQPKGESPVAVVGYPERDPRDNPEHLIVSFFGEEFGVKRFAPGRVMSSDAWMLEHDASTLGGNSGSVVLAMETGEAIGLHFAGAAQERNLAVPADTVAAALRRLTTSLAMPAIAGDIGAGGTEASGADDFADREGYERGFLGRDVAPPAPGAWEADLAPVEGGGTELRYCHFSVWQSRSRRLPLLTAVNIDGSRLRRLPREGRWRLDGRLDPAHQIGNALYRKNPLDKGHMVRRLDPCWAEDIADEATVLKAQADTFHYTNSVPQHKDLNQRDWAGLEDYLLDASQDFGFRLGVMTGPVFREDDRSLKEQDGAGEIAIPREFWKVAVMCSQDDGALSTTGYVLSHGEMIRGLTEAEFVLGEYETYQVPLRLIEEATGLDFGTLKDGDPLNVATMREAAFGAEVRRVRGSRDLTLRPVTPR
ncbi:MAG: DNA/RNA non-specific endonuclease [Paracoccaceae bacterium]|nr:DNA/RNA non-specific endonuclease [Paracoccaceae bacterium]